MGGKPTGVTEATTEIVLEAAWFLPATVRRTSRRLGLMSDSSYRYERRVDPGALLAARDRALALLQELTARSTISQPAIAGADGPGRAGPITLRTERIEGLLGHCHSRPKPSRATSRGWAASSCFLATIRARPLAAADLPRRSCRARST